MFLQSLSAMTHVSKLNKGVCDDAFILKQTHTNFRFNPVNVTQVGLALWRH